MRTNRRINIYAQATPSGIGGTRTLQMRRSGVRAWVTLSKTLFVGLDGTERSSDGTIRTHHTLALTESEIIGVVGTDRRYRVEGVQEVFAATGNLAGHRARLIRDTSVEP